MICWADKEHETTVHVCAYGAGGKWRPACGTNTGRADIRTAMDGERPVTCEKCLKKFT